MTLAAQSPLVSFVLRFYAVDRMTRASADTYTSALASATVALTAAKELLRSGESVFTLS